jgi:hypothetical protein
LHSADYGVKRGLENIIGGLAKMIDGMNQFKIRQAK